MSDTTTADQAMAKASGPVSQCARTPARRPIFGNLFGGEQRREISEAIKGVCRGEEGAAEKLTSLYMSPSMDLKDKARALAQMAREFNEQTMEMCIDENRAAAGANLADALRTLAISCALEARNPDIDAAIQKMSAQISVIIEDETECNVYHNHPGLRLSCARAAFALLGDTDTEARMEMLSHSVRDDQLQVWALDVAMKNDYAGVMEQCCHKERLVPAIIGQEKGRAIMLGAISAAENGERAAMLKSVSDAGGPAVMLLFTKLVEDPKMALDVLECAAVSSAVTLADELALVSRLLEKGGDASLERALHYPGTRAMAIRCLVGSEKGNALVMQAVEDSGQENEMLRILARQGEPKIQHILEAWSNRRETRDYFFRAAGMLKAPSMQLQEAVATYTTVIETDRRLMRAAKRESKAARKSFTKMMAAEAECRASAFKAALEKTFEFVSAAITKGPGLEQIAVKATGEIHGIEAEVTAGFSYEKAGEETPAPEDRAKMKIAALKNALGALYSTVSEFLLIKPRLESLPGMEIEAEEGCFQLHAKADLAFKTE